MALPDLTGLNIEDTYPRLVHTDGVDYFDGTGSLLDLGQNPRTVVEQVKNVSGIFLSKGTPVHATGSGTSGNLVGIIAADAGDPTKMPATYVLNTDLDDEEEGEAIAVGYIQGVDTRGLIEGEVVYVAVGGGWTQTKPTGSALIQNLGVVTKVGQNGSGVVLGAGRSNDLPNIQSGYTWVGNSNGVPTAVPTSSLIIDPFPYTGSAIISGSLGVSGSLGEILVDNGLLRIYDNDKSHNLFFQPGSNAVTLRSINIGNIVNFSLDSNLIAFSQPTSWGGGSPTSTGRIGIRAHNDTSFPFFIQNSNGTPLLYTQVSSSGLDGKVGIRTLSPATELDVSGSTTLRGNTIITGSNSLTNSSALRIVNSSGTNVLSVNNDGNVGIGTITPSQALDVNGVIKVSDKIEFPSVIKIGSNFVGNVGGTYSIYIGHDAGKNDSQPYNVLVGFQAGAFQSKIERTSIGSISKAGNYSVAIGRLSSADGSTDYSVSIGNESARYTSGSNNVSIGYQAAQGIQNSSSFSNTVAVGYQALKALTTGDQNIAIGYLAADLLTEGDYNIALGPESAKSLTTGNYNVSIGWSANGSVSTNSNNVALGHDANRSTGQNNTAIGHQALGNTNGTASNIVAIGYQALTALTTGTSNTAIGYRAGLVLTTGGGNTLLGNSAGDTITSGINNVLIGNNADVRDGTNSNNTIIGASPTAHINAANQTGVGYGVKTGNESTAVGSSAGSSTSTRQVAIGYQAGTNSGTSTSAVLIGYFAGQSATALGTIAIGHEALKSATGLENIAIGYQSGDAVTSGQYNTFLGYQAGSTVTTLSHNTFIGRASGINSTGEGNTYVGSDTGYNKTSGNNNVIIGRRAGLNSATGSSCVFIGYEAGQGETNSNRLYIDNSGTTTPLIYGEFDNDLVRINGRLETSGSTTISGSLTVTDTITELSAERFKENIHPLTGSLEKANQLQGVSFNRIGQSEKEIGFIAEQVAVIFPELVDRNENDEITGVQYSRVTAILLESVKELSLKLNKIEARLERLENK